MNWQKFHKRIQGFKGWRTGAFILALAERALPNAQLYFAALDESERSLSPDALQHKVDRAWQVVITAPSEQEQIDLLDSITAHVPALDEHSPYGAFPAADCLELLEQALLSGINPEQEARSVIASQRSVATITQFIEVTEGDTLSEAALIKRFDRHDLMLREYSFQEEVCDLLRGADRPSDKVLDEVRALARDEGISNIGISLDTGEA